MVENTAATPPTTVQNALDNRIRVHRGASVFYHPSQLTVAGTIKDVDNRMTTDYIARGDGLTQTLLISENLQARQWISPYFNDIGFGWAVSTGETAAAPANGFAYTINAGDTVNGMGFATFTDDFQSALRLNDPPLLETEETPTIPGAGINKNIQAAEGSAPRPSSNHPGTVVCVYADGHAGTLSDRIDDSVYVRLLSPNGVEFGQVILGDADEF